MREIYTPDKFRVSGAQVIYDPPVYKNADGSIAHNLSTIICEVTEYLENPEDVARQIADALNSYSQSKREK